MEGRSHEPSAHPATRIETLRKDAKRWLKALRAGDAAARARLAEALASPPPEPGLRDVQLALAREYGLPGWTELKAAVQALAADRLSRRERIDAVLRHGWAAIPPASSSEPLACRARAWPWPASAATSRRWSGG